VAKKAKDMTESGDLEQLDEMQAKQVKAEV
jgi:hypothetical protein